MNRDNWEMDHEHAALLREVGDVVSRWRLDGWNFGVNVERKKRGTGQNIVILVFRPTPAGTYNVEESVGTGMSEKADLGGGISAGPGERVGEFVIGKEAGVSFVFDIDNIDRLVEEAQSWKRAEILRLTEAKSKERFAKALYELVEAGGHAGLSQENIDAAWANRVVLLGWIKGPVSSWTFKAGIKLCVQAAAEGRSEYAHLTDTDLERAWRNKDVLLVEVMR